MKRINGYMVPKYKSSAKKIYYCSCCKKRLLPNEAYCYVDPNNFAITMNSSAYCKECYIDKYGRY